MTARVRIGTCSFADEALTRYWYPRGTRTGEERLRYYADRFDTVEIDSTFYRLPEPETTANWAERTPDDFVFHVKAFAPLTRHPVREQQLPPDLRDGLPLDDRGRVERVPREVRAEIFRRFEEGIQPIRAAGKLGGVLLQLAPYVVYKPSALEYLEWAAAQAWGERLLVEFRHASWLEEENRADVLSFLEDRGMSLVIVDAPNTGGRNVIPTVAAVTSPVAYLRLHGRNASTWNKRGGSAAERFDYLYSREELKEWVGPLRELAEQAEEVYAVFNNNNTSERPPGLDDPDLGGREEGGQLVVAQAAANALMLRQLLAEAGVRV